MNASINKDTPNTLKHIAHGWCLVKISNSLSYIYNGQWIGWSTQFWNLCNFGFFRTRFRALIEHKQQNRLVGLWAEACAKIMPSTGQWKLLRLLEKPIKLNEFVSKRALYSIQKNKIKKKLFYFLQFLLHASLKPTPSSLRRHTTKAHLRAFRWPTVWLLSKTLLSCKRC